MDEAGHHGVLAEIPVVIDYGQIFVFASSVRRAGLLWTDDHVKQGFAWAPGTVCFGVPDQDGYDLVRIELSADASIAPEALWALRVPFDVEGDGVQVGTVGVYHTVPVPEGRYALSLQVVPGHGMVAENGEDYARVLHLTFCPDPQPDFRIVKQGDELQTDHVLTARAEYA